MTERMKLWWHSRAGRWYIVGYPGGKMRSTRTTDRAKAERIMEKVKRNLLEERLVRLDRSPRVSLSTFTAEYLKTLEGRNPKTRQQARLSLRHFADFWGDRPLQVLSVKVIEQYRGHMRSMFASTHTVNHYLRGLKRALRTARRWGILKPNSDDISLDATQILEALRQFNLVLSRPLDHTRDDAMRVLRAAAEYDVPCMRLAVPIMFYTGIARAELLGPLHIGPTHLSYTRRKTGRPVSVPIHPSLRATLATLGEGIHRIVPWRSPRTFSRHFERIIKAAGIRGLSPHGVRHLFASLMVSEGVDINQVSAWLGHSSVDITLKYYAHLVPGRDTGEMEKLSYE